MKTIVSYLASLARGGQLRPRGAPFVKYTIVLLAVVLLYGWLFHVIMAWEGQDHSWFTGIYWALTVMSTLGFGDITFQSDLGRAFSTLVLLTGIVMLLVILPFLFIRFVYAPWLEEQGRRRRRALRAVPPGISGHVLICARSPIAPGLIKRLELADIPAYVIEPDAVIAGQLRDDGVPVMTGEIDAVQTYGAARVQDARLVFANATDTVNTNIVLTVRELAPSVPIAAVAESEDSVDVLELSGATHVLPLKQRLGEQLANRVSAGITRANVIGRYEDLLLAEFPAHDTPLEGRTIRQTKLREATGASIVGVWENGRLRPPDPDLKLSRSAVPVVIATAEQIQALDELLVIYAANPNPVIVIGGGKVGCAAAGALKKRDVPVHMVERNERLKAKIASIPDQLFLGDAADIDVLTAAGVRQAPTILLTTHADAMNVYLTVYCRRLNPEARLVTRVTHERNVEAILRAGADFVLSYVSLGVESVFSIIRGRQPVVLGEGVDLFHIPVPRAHTGRTLADLSVGARTGLNVVAVQEEGRIVTNPQAAHILADGCTLLALGSTQQRKAFDDCFE